MEKPMTPPDLVRRLRAEWSDAVAALDGWPGSPTKEMVLALVRAGDDLSAVLASPPEAPAPPEPECTGPFTSAFDCPKCNPRKRPGTAADLVALVLEWQAALLAPSSGDGSTTAWDVSKRLAKARNKLLAWTPHAASGPPSAPPETVKDNDCAAGCLACSGEICMSHEGKCECDSAQRHVDRWGKVFVGRNAGMFKTMTVIPTAPPVVVPADVDDSSD